MFEGCIGYYPDGKVRQSYCVFQDITDRKKLELERIESAAELESLIENREDSIWSLDKELNFIVFNSFFAEAYRSVYNIDLQVGSNAIKILTPELKKIWEPKYRAVLKGENLVFEFTLEISGINNHFQVSLNPIISEGSVTGISAISINITDRKNAEQELRESKLKYKLLADFTYDWEYWIDPAGKYIYISPSVERITGYTADEFSNNSEILFNMIRDDYRGEISGHYKNENNIDEPVFSTTFPIITKSGKEVWISHTCSPVFDESGTWIGRRGNNRDITVRKKAEESLKESEDRYKNIVENLLVGIVIHVDFHIAYVNYSLKNLMGYNLDEQFIGKNVLEFVHPDDQKKSKKAISIVSKYPKPLNDRKPFVLEARFIKSDKSEIIVESTAININYHGKAAQMIMIKDITKSKIAENKLRESEDRLSKIMIAANDGMWDWNLKTNAVYFDPRYYVMAGYDVKEFPFKLEEFQKRIHPDDTTNVMDEVQKHLNGKTKRFFVEFRFKRKDDNWMWVMGRGYIVERDKDGSPQRLIGTHTDITVRKNAENKLKESEEKFRTLIDEIPLGIYITNGDGKCYYVNPTWCNMSGLSMEEAKDDGWKMGIHPEDRDKVFSNWNRMIKSKGKWGFEYRMFDGANAYWIDGRAKELKSDGKLIGFLGINSDITERKLAELELKESKAFNETLINTSPDNIYIYDIIDQKNIYSNERILEILGYSVTELKEIGEDFVSQLMHPDDLMIYFNKTIPQYQTCKDDEIIEHEYRMKHKNGEWRWLHSKEIIFKRLKDGKPEQIFGISADVTEQKIAVHKISESQHRYKKLFEDSPVALWEEDFSELITKLKQLKEDGVTDLNKFLDENPKILAEMADSVKILNLNKASVKLHKAQTKENLLVSLDRTFTEKSLLVFKNEVIAVADGRDYFESVIEMKTLTGELKIVNIQLNLDRTKEVESTKVIGLVALTDITEEIASRSELEKSKLQLRELNLHAQNIREQERTDISREIHDSLGQALTALKMDLAWIQKKSQINDTELLSKFDEMKDLLDETTSSVQKISTDLRPGLLDDLGLTYALDWQCREFEKRTEIKSTLKLKPKNIELSEKISVALFRIVQESLTNVMRHAKATEVVISLAKKKNIVELKITDNGIGINEDNTEDPRSLGLLGITERAYAINSEVSFLGKKEGGTEVKVIVPLENEDTNK